MWIHLSDDGCKILAPVLGEARFDPGPGTVRADLRKLHAEVQEKNLQFFHDVHAINVCNIYDGRKSPFGVVNFPAEFVKLRKMIENLEQRIWAVAKG